MSVYEVGTDYSLRTRLLIAFSILLFFFLGLTGVILDRAFSNSIEAGAEDRLQVQVYLLLGAAEQDDGEFYFLETLQEPRFNQLDSGLYGFISGPAVGELWRSDSAITFGFADPNVLRERIAVGDTWFTTVQGEQGDEYFMLSYGILWEDGISEYNFSVVENTDPYYSEISNFRTSLWYWLGGVAVVLLAIQFLLLRWGLSPLQRMAVALKLIESGETDKLAGSYPKELQGVTRNLNLLIESERKQQARYRTTLGDLAHSLKTPLAVLSGVMQALDKNPDLKQGETLQQLESGQEQVDRMNQIVTYQLQRAVQSEQTSSLSRQVNISKTIDKIVDALEKVYAGKSMIITKHLDRELDFRGDERDLMEVLGNVLDNAFKYGNSRIEISAQESATGSYSWQLTVDDDGPGIAEEQQEFVLQRGARADTLVHGHGIGLAVVTDIVNSYDGEICIGSSPLGGARIQIRFSVTQ